MLNVRDEVFLIENGALLGKHGGAGLQPQHLEAEAEAGGLRLTASLGYIMRSCLEKSLVTTD